MGKQDSLVRSYKDFMDFHFGSSGGSGHSSLPKRMAPTPAHLKNCPPPTWVFIGREDVLSQMRTYFSTDVGERHVFVLHGLGGAGKSQIAFKFVKES